MIIVFFNQGDFFRRNGPCSTSQTAQQDRSAWVAPKSEMRSRRSQLRKFRELSHAEPDLLRARRRQMA